MDEGNKFKEAEDRQKTIQDLQKPHKRKLINVSSFLVTCSNIRLERTGATTRFCVTMERFGKKSFSQSIINQIPEQIAVGNDKISLMVTYYSFWYPEFGLKKTNDQNIAKRFPRRPYTIAVREGHSSGEALGRTKIDISKHIISNEGHSVFCGELDSGIKICMDIDHKKIDVSRQIASTKQRNVQSLSNRLLQNFTSYRRKRQKKQLKTEHNSPRAVAVEDVFDDIKVDSDIRTGDFVSSAKKNAERELFSNSEINNIERGHKNNNETVNTPSSECTEKLKSDTMVLQEHVSNLSKEIKDQDEKIRKTMEELSRREKKNNELQRTMAEMNQKLVSENLKELESVEKKVEKAKKMYALTEQENEVLRKRKKEKDEELKKLKRRLGQSSP